MDALVLSFPWAAAASGEKRHRTSKLPHQHPADLNGFLINYTLRQIVITQSLYTIALQTFYPTYYNLKKQSLH